MYTSAIAGEVEAGKVLSDEVITAITTGCQNVATGATQGITAILPMGMSIMALTLGVRIAVGFFRSLAH